MAACCWACVDNDEGEPSHLENNWYALTYNPNAGPLEQEIYAIYEQTGIPIFLSDTLGAQIRYDLGGNPYTYYNMFSPGYNYTNYTSTYTYSLEREEADLEAMVDLLGNYALRPYFRNDYGEEFVGKFGPHALVVLDSITRGSTPDTLLMDLGVIGLSTRYTMKTGTGSSASNFTGARDLTEKRAPCRIATKPSVFLAREPKGNFQARLLACVPAGGGKFPPAFRAPSRALRSGFVPGF